MLLKPRRFKRSDGVSAWSLLLAELASLARDSKGADTETLISQGTVEFLSCFNLLRRFPLVLWYSALQALPALESMFLWHGLVDRNLVVP